MQLYNLWLIFHPTLLWLEDYTIKQLQVHVVWLHVQFENMIGLCLFTCDKFEFKTKMKIALIGFEIFYLYSHETYDGKLITKLHLAYGETINGFIANCIKIGQKAIYILLAWINTSNVITAFEFFPIENRHKYIHDWSAY